VGEAQAASPRLAAASPRSPKVRGAQSVLGTRPRYAVHPHRRRRTRKRCARARRGQFRAGKRQGGRASERADSLRPSAAGVVRGGWCAVAGVQCAVRVQTQLSANCLLVVAWGSAGRSLGQVSASFVVFCDGRRTPRLHVLSLLRLCGDMLKRARGSERRGVVICRCVECRERDVL